MPKAGGTCCCYMSLERSRDSVIVSVIGRKVEWWRKAGCGYGEMCIKTALDHLKIFCWSISLSDSIGHGIFFFFSDFSVHTHFLIFKNGNIFSYNIQKPLVNAYYGHWVFVEYMHGKYLYWGWLAENINVIRMWEKPVQMHLGIIHLCWMLHSLYSRQVMRYKWGCSCSIICNKN